MSDGPMKSAAGRNTVLAAFASVALLATSVSPSAAASSGSAPALSGKAAASHASSDATDFSAARRRHYRRGSNAAGLAFMGAAAGIIGGVIAEQRRRDYYENRYYYGPRPYYGGPGYYGGGSPITTIRATVTGRTERSLRRGTELDFAKGRRLVPPFSIRRYSRSPDGAKRNPGPLARHLALSRMSLRSSGLRTGPVVALCQPALPKIFHFTEIRFRRMYRPSRLTRRGDLVVVLIASRVCDGRGSVGMRGAGRAGCPCELVTACGRRRCQASPRL